MATTNITVPTKEARLDRRRAWVCDISTVIAAGNDVQFVDEENVNTYVNFLQCDSAGYIEFYGMGQTQLQRCYFIAGGWHKNQMSFIRAAGTEADKGFHAKLEL